MKQKIRITFQMVKKEIYNQLVKLIGTLVNNDKYKHNEHDDLDYYGIRDIENLFDGYNDDDYYKPILAKSSFNENYKYYESRGDKEKKYYLQKNILA